MNHVKIINIESNILFVPSTPSRPQEDQDGFKKDNSTSLEGYIQGRSNSFGAILSLSLIVRYPEARSWEMQSWRRVERGLKRSVKFWRQEEDIKIEILGHLSLTRVNFLGRSKSLLQPVAARSKLLLLCRSCHCQLLLLGRSCC